MILLSNSINKFLFLILKLTQNKKLIALRNMNKLNDVLPNLVYSSTQY